MSSSQKIILVVVALAVVGGLTYFLTSGSGSTQTTPTDTNAPRQVVTTPTPTTAGEGGVQVQPATMPQATTSAATTSPSQSTSATSKKVSVTTDYAEPSGTASVGFNLTVDAAGVITDVTVDQLGTKDKNKETANYQRKFAAALPAAIKGKKLATLTALDGIGGASLTTDAFNQSLDKLKAGL